MIDKKASPDFPIHKLLAERWSPYAFADKLVPKEDLSAIFEAARWAASSYNEQPWSYIVASKDMPQEFARVLSCLVEPNQAWAKNVPVLALGIINTKFSHNGKENRVAAHDLGAASASLTFEATARGLVVHQMAGIEQDKAREAFEIPKDYVAWTALAIGYVGDSDKLPEDFKKRDYNPRQRKPLSKFVFTGKWGNSSSIVSKGA